MTSATSNTQPDQKKDDELKDAILNRQGNEVDGLEQPASGLRPGLGRDKKDVDGGGVGNSQ